MGRVCVPLFRFFFGGGRGTGGDDVTKKASALYQVLYDAIPAVATHAVVAQREEGKEGNQTFFCCFENRKLKIEKKIKN